MADQRNGGIGWTDTTWNCVRGCSRVSPGCENCYAETMAGRFCGPGQPYEGLVRIKEHRRHPGSNIGDGEVMRREARWTGVVRLVPEHLADPLRWKRPRRVFVNSMSDLFHEGLSNEEIAAVFGVMAASPQHTFQVLTKRAERMREWFAWVDSTDDSTDIQQITCAALDAAGFDRGCGSAFDPDAWPLPNVWLGVSVENQKYADERIPLLLETPAALRFVSAEPLLGPVDFRRVPGFNRVGLDLSRWWIIAGCESGPGARPTSPAWFASLRDQCQAASVPYFLKQAKQHGEAMRAGPGSTTKAGGVIAAPYLDGKQWLEFPR